MTMRVRRQMWDIGWGAPTIGCSNKRKILITILKK